MKLLLGAPTVKKSVNALKISTDFHSVAETSQVQCGSQWQDSVGHNFPLVPPGVK